MDDLRPKRLDRPDLLESPAFWAIHFDLQAGGGSPLERLFGLSPESLQAFWREELKDSVPGDSHLYPCYRLRLPLPGGASASVEYRRHPEDSGLDYFVHRPSWPEPLLLGSREGHFMLPALRWEEVIQIAEAVRRVSDHPALHRAAVPLLFPALCLSPDDDLVRIGDRLRLAWAELGVADPAHLDDLVGRMIEASRVDFRWWEDDLLGWVNDSPWSLRNPRVTTDPKYFRQIDEFFSALFGSGFA